MARGRVKVTEYAGMNIIIDEDVHPDTIIISPVHWAEIMAGGQRRKNQIAVIKWALEAHDPEER